MGSSIVLLEYPAIRMIPDYASACWDELFLQQLLVDTPIDTLGLGLKASSPHSNEKLRPSMLGYTSISMDLITVFLCRDIRRTMSIGNPYLFAYICP